MLLYKLGQDFLNALCVQEVVALQKSKNPSKRRMPPIRQNQERECVAQRLNIASGQRL